MSYKLLNCNDFITYKNPDLKSNQDFVNNYINEAKSVSYESSRMVEIIDDKLQSLIKDKHNVLYTDIDINGRLTNGFRFKTNPVILVFGRECELRLNFINITYDMSIDEMKVISRKYTKAKTIRKEPDYSGNLKDYIEIAYILDATIVLYKNEMTLYSKSALSHELRHCYVYLKNRGKKSVRDELEKTVRNSRWNKIYDYCENYLNGCNDGHLKYGEEFYKIIYGLYSCDVEELDAFVQQAYDYVKSLNCNTREMIKDELEQTDLWTMMNNLHDAMNILKKTDYKKKFNSLGKFVSNGILPNASKTYSLLNKVYKNACSRYGKVLMTLIDEMNEDKLDENHLNLNYDWFYILNRNNTYIDYELY